MENNENKEIQENQVSPTKVRRKNFLAEMWQFAWKQKAYWIFPVIVFLILLIFLIAVGTSPVSPFIYTII